MQMQLNKLVVPTPSKPPSHVQPPPPSSSRSSAARAAAAASPAAARLPLLLPAALCTRRELAGVGVAGDGAGQAPSGELGVDRHLQTVYRRSHGVQCRPRHDFKRLGAGEDLDGCRGEWNGG